MKNNNILENLLYEDNARELITNMMVNDIKEGAFQIVLQPIFNFKGEVVMAESLMRYLSQDETIFPDDFIPILELRDLIHQIDLYSFESACMLLKKWEVDSYQIIPISVNLSRRTLMRESLFEQMEGIRKKYHVPKNKLIIEITESAKSSEPILEKEIITKLKEEGYTLSLDDFGVDYSNLKSYIEYPYKIIKIDKGLTEGLEANWKSKILLKNVIEVSHKLGFCVIAEGIENQEQYEYFLQNNCDMVQGYYMEKPLDILNFEEKYCKKKIVQSFTYEKEGG